MQTLVRKIGNSTGTIIPAAILKKHNLKEGDRVDIQDKAVSVDFTAGRGDKGISVDIDINEPQPEAEVVPISLDDSADLSASTADDESVFS